MIVVSIGDTQHYISTAKEVLPILSERLKLLETSDQAGVFSDGLALQLIQATLDDKHFEGWLSRRRIEIASAEYEFYIDDEAHRTDVFAFLDGAVKSENDKYPFSVLVNKCMSTRLKEIFLPLFGGGIFNRIETAELLLECNRHPVLTDQVVDCVILKHIKDLERRGVSFPVSPARQARLDCYKEAAKALSVRAIFLAEELSKTSTARKTLSTAA